MFSIEILFNSILKSHFGVQHHITYMYRHRNYQNTPNHSGQNYKRLYIQDLYEQNMALKRFTNVSNKDTKCNLNYLLHFLSNCAELASNVASQVIGKVAHP